MTTTREQWIADARAVLDLLETNPDLPLNLASGVIVNYCPLKAEGDAEAMAAVDAVADMLGVAVTPPGPGSHYEAAIQFGSASYRAIAVLKDYRNRRAAIERLGEAALEAEKQAVRSVDAADDAEVAWLLDEFDVALAAGKAMDEEEDESRFTRAQMDGEACTECGGNFAEGEPTVPSAYDFIEGQLFAHVRCAEEALGDVEAAEHPGYTTQGGGEL